jgi:hypothetical protein
MKVFLDEITDALSRDASYDEVIAVVRRYKDGGLSQECVYDLLELTWLRLGCRDEERSRNCDLLEGVLEVVWGHCPASRMLWEDSLNDERVAAFRGSIEVDELRVRAHREGTPEALRNATLVILNKRFPDQITPEVVSQIHSQTRVEILGDWLLFAARLPTLEEIATYVLH